VSSVVSSAVIPIHYYMLPSGTLKPYATMRCMLTCALVASVYCRFIVTVWQLAQGRRRAGRIERCGAGLNQVELTKRNIRKKRH